MTPKQRYHAILAEVCARDGLPLGEALCHSRRRVISWARFEAWAKLRHEKGWTYQRIADLAGYDHANVLYGIRRYDERNPPVQWAFKSIRSAA